MMHQSRLVLFFIHWLIEPFFLVLVYLTCMALDMIGRLIYQIKNIFFIPGVLVSTQEIPKFSKTTCWHVMDAQNTIP